MASKPKVVTLIPCLGKADETRACLESVAADPYPNHEVLVIENETDQNVKMLQSLFPKVRFFRNEKNEGFTGAVNRGIQEGKSLNPDFYFLLNNDAVLKRGAIESLVFGLLSNPRAGMAAPKILADDRKKILWAAGGEFFPKRFLARNRGQGNPDSERFSRMEKCPFLSGCALLVRASVIQAVGNLDEKFFTYAEDLDFSLRMRSAGWELLYEPAAVVVHPGSQTSGSQYEPFQSFYRWRNRLLIVSKHAGLIHGLFFYFLFFPLLVLRDLTVYVRKGKISSIPYLFRGLFQFAGIQWLHLRLEPMRRTGKGKISSRLKNGYLLSNPAAVFFLSILDGLGKNFSAFFPRKNLPENVRKILLAKTDHLGDVILSLQAIPALKMAFPHADIDFLCGSWSKFLVENNPSVRQVLTFDDFRLNRKGSKLRRIQKWVEDSFHAVKAMRKEAYDLAIDLRAYYPNFIPWLSISGAKHRAGFSTGGFGFFLDTSGPWKEGIHETEHFMELLRALAPSAKRAKLDLSYLADERETKAFLDASLPSPENPFVIIHAFCQKSFLRDQKHWKMEEWRNLIGFFERKGLTVFCSGDSEDEPLIRQITEGGKAVNLGGRASIGLLAGLALRARLCVAVDTFFSHLSGALGAKTFVIFNEVEPVEQWKPWGEFVQTFPIESRSSDLENQIQFALEKSKQPVGALNG